MRPEGPGRAGPADLLAEGHLQEHPIGVLLVDDQAIVGEAVRRMLAPETDVRFQYCADPTHAIEVARRFAPTVILADLVMPQMDGLELVRRLRAEDATGRTPLIVLSSKEEATTKAQAFAAGANDYLVKLPDRVELVARIRYHSAAHTHRIQRDEAFAALEHSRQLLADDLEQAARYVRSILPEPLEGPVSAVWTFVPSDALGGDAFSYHWLDEDRFAAYLLDVSGHGVGSALLSVSVLNALRGGMLRQVDFRDPAQVLARLDETFTVAKHGGKYFTIWYGVYDRAERVLRWSGGGHPPALLVRRAGESPLPLESPGPMPGVVRGTVWSSGAERVPPGARLLLYSDGVYEIRRPDGSLHGIEDFLADLGGPSAGQGLLERAFDRARRLKGPGPFDDDVALVEFRFD